MGEVAAFKQLCMKQKRLNQQELKNCGNDASDKAREQGRGDDTGEHKTALHLQGSQNAKVFWLNERKCDEIVVV